MIQIQRSTVRLRKKLSPYTFLFVIFGLLSVLMFIQSFIAKDQEGLLLSLCILPFGGILVFGILSSYRIYWNENGITMGVDWHKKTIPFNEIASVKYTLGDYAAPNSPFRRFERIVIGGHSSRKNYVEVSFHHFRYEDIATLLDEISRRRPDIEIPWQSIRNANPE